jgi:serine/threonine protein kinase
MQKRFSQYYLTEQLASKPLRSVYLAHCVSDASEKVVVKIFDAVCLNLEQERESLLQKVEWAKQFKHSHIVPVLDFGVEQGKPYVVSKYLSRGSLRYHLDHLSPQRLDLQDALHIVFQVGQALCYAHQHNILHSNIKPENIFFTKQGKVLLADFRLASFVNVTKLNYKSDPHTTCYMAPEQFNGTSSEKSDQYALACLTYELITGRTPFSAQGFFSMWAKQSTQEPVPPSDLVPELPAAIERAVLRGMAKDPSERYANVSAFLRALETISPSYTSPSTSTSIRRSIAPASKTLDARGTEPLDPIASGAPLVATHLSKKPLATSLLDHPEPVHHKHSPDQSTEPLDLLPSNSSLATRLSKNSLTTRLIDHHKHGSDQSTEPLDLLPSNSSLATRLSKNSLATHLLDHSEHVHHKRDSSQSTEPLDDLPSNSSLATHLSKNPLTPRLLDHHKHEASQSTEPLDLLPSNPSLATHRVDYPEHIHHKRNSSQTLDTVPSMTMDTPPKQTWVEPLPIGRLPQSGKPAASTLWLAFALSSVVLLIGTVMLYAFVPPLQSPTTVPHKSVQSTPPIPTVTLTPQPTVQPQVTPNTPPSNKKSTISSMPIVPQIPQSVTQPVQSSLTYSYAQQTNQTYNLTTDGTLDWVDWGLNTPQDLNHKANGPRQISNFTVIGNGTVQRASYSSNSYIEWFDGTPETAAAPQQAPGVYVAGVNNGFSITVPASTTRKTLKLYVGANLAHGKLTASLDGQPISDATLDTTHDPNNTQGAGIYTLVFNGSAPDQVLTVTYTAIATNGNNGYVLLQAATLQ